MESQNKESEYIRSIWEKYNKEWETANREKRLELNKRMLRWQEIRKSGLSAEQAYIRVMQEGVDYIVREKPSVKLPTIPFVSNMRKLPLVFLNLALVVAIAYGVIITVAKNVNTEAEPVKNILATTQAELGSTKQMLALTRSELNSTKQTLAATQAELSSANQTLAETQAELSSTNQTLASIQQDLTTLQTTLSKTKQQLAVAQETLGGLGITLYASKENSDVDLIDNRTAKNPTLGQLVDFILQDQTDRLPYVTDVYDSSQLSRDVHNHAEAAGIRAAVVDVQFRNEPEGRALNAFLTTDYGLVYVDSAGTPDKIARVKKGKELLEVGFYYGIPATIIRRDDWWDTLSSYVLPDLIYGIPSIISSIDIYW